MCVTRYKEKVGKYAPVSAYAQVHYYKEKVKLRGYTDQFAMLLK